MEKNQKSPGSQKPWKTEKNKKKKHLPKGARIALYVLLGLVVLLVIGGVSAGLWANHFMDKDPEQRVDTEKLPIGKDMFEFEGELPEIENPVGRKAGFYNILIIGRDKVALNTDVILCASFDITNSKAATVQIPRDSYVKDKNGNTSKINAVFARGYTAARRELSSLKQNGKGKTDEELTTLCKNSSLDIDLATLKDFLDGKTKQETLCTRFGMEFLQEVISSTFGIYFDYYAVVSTDAFVKIVDAVGGVDIDVQQDMDYDDPEQNLYIHIKKGPQHLDGKQAEGFVRFRHGYVQADIARMDAQKIFLTAFFKKLVSFSSITRVDEILKAVYDSVDTDMSLENALGFVKPALSVDLSGITMLNMQGTPYRNGMYYSLNKAENLKIVNEHFNIFTHPLSESAVQVEELVQSTATDSDATKGRTMEDIDENRIDLGFIGGSHRSSGGSGNSSGGHTNPPADPDPEPSVPVIAQPEDNTPSDEPQGGDETDASKDPPAEPVENENESENGGGNGNEGENGSGDNALPESDAPAADPNGGMTETPENGNETPAPAEGSSDDVPPPAA